MLDPQKLQKLYSHNDFAIKDLSLKNVLGIGDQCEGLYYYNNQDSKIEKNDSINVFQDVNHINFFDIEYPEIPNDDERVANNLYKNKSDSSSSLVSGSNINTADFLVDNSRNDADSKGIDYEETFSPVVEMVIVRCLLNIVVCMSWPVFQLDVNNAFLYGDLEEVVYMKPPKGYFPYDNKVCRLKKSLYGLKQAHKQWNAKLTSTLIENGFSQSKTDYSLYTKLDKGVFLALLVYMDDIIITGNNISEIEKFKVFLKSKFMIKDLVSHVDKGPLDASEDTLLSLRRPVDEVSSVIDDVFDIDESNVEGMQVRDKFAEFFEDKGSVEKVLSATKLPKDGNSHSAYSPYHLEDKVNFKRVGNVTPWATEVGRRKKVKCYVQGSGRRKRKNGMLGKSIKSAFQDNTLRASFFIIYVHNSLHNSPVNSDHDDDDVQDPDPVTRISKLDISDPLHLHPNDTTALTVVSIKLKGTKNYQVWPCAMLLALKGKNKIGFIDGICRRSNTDETLGKQWDRVNAIVLGWILNLISEELFLGQIFSKRAKHVWEELKETYDKVDGSIMFGLHHHISTLKQNGSSIVDYYHKLNALWKQYDAMIELPKCVCNASESFKKHNQLLKLMQFLMGLDDSYMQIRSSILSREVLPNVRSAYATISSEESYRVAAGSITSGFPQRNQVSGSSQNLNSRPRLNNLNNNRQGGNSGLVCEKCGFNGHTIDRCFKIIGYPADFGKKKSNQSFKGKNISNNNSVGSSSSSGFIDEHIDTLISLIKDNKAGKNVQANMAANQHTTYTDKELDNVIDISHLKIKDLSLKNVLGIGDQCEGLYYYNNQVDNSGNDADSSDELVATQNEEVATLEENVVSEGNLDQNLSSSHGVKNVRRSSRQSVFPRNYNDFVVESKVKYGLEKYVCYSKLNSENLCFVTQLNKTREPKTYFEAFKYPHWTDAMNQEMDALLRNGTWEIVELPEGRKAIRSKWIYKIKFRSSGEIDRYKARLVAQGFGQKEGIDYEETFSPVVKMEVVYIKPPEGYFPSDNKVCRLKKSLYGLKQALRQLNAKLTSTLIENGFSQSKSDYSLYTKSDKGVFLALLVYVDDIIITGNSISEIEKFKVFLKFKFMIKDLGKLKYFLGIEVVDTDKGICLNQKKYVLDLLSEYGLGIHIARKSKKQNTLSKSSTEAEYKALASVTSEGVVKTVKVDSANQIAYILTKGLDTVQHVELVKRLESLAVNEQRLKVEGLVLPSVDSFIKMRYANETEDMELQVSESQSKLAYANDTQNIEMEAGDSPTNLNSKGAKRKEYKDRSRVGNHFTKFFDNNEKPRAKCNYCGAVYSGETKSRTSTLWGHLNKSVMIIIDKLPLKFVENEGFQRCIKMCQPTLVVPSRSTITRDCYQLYVGNLGS
ncbi:ribonuclease H-like domain-containing protein [Tanacetum coccineum]